MRSPVGRIPSLDGLRALSILCVLIGHLVGTRGFPVVPYSTASAMAVLGVRVFFVISGFLITSLLLDEEARSGTVSLRRFYFRRTMRIFPPFYAYVAFVALASALGWVELREHDLLSAVTYTTNYHHDRSWYLGHTWSLAVEEQFYLLWPFLVKFLGSRRAAHAALATVVGAPLLRFGLLVAAPGFRDGIGETFPTVADAIATGCLLACYRERLVTWRRWTAFVEGPAFWLVPALAFAAAFVPSTKVDHLFGQTVTNIGVALLVDRVVRHPGLPTGRFLNARPVAFVGVLSYSMYLWQQPFLNRHSERIITAFPINVALVMLVAAVSYYAIERPALRLRGRLESSARQTPAAGTAPGT